VSQFVKEVRADRSCPRGLIPVTIDDPDPRKCEVVSRYFARCAQPARAAWMAAGLIIGGLISVTIATGEFAQPAGTSWSDDMRNVWTFKSGTTHILKFPLVRDFPSFIMILASVVYIPISYSQLDAFSRVFGTLGARGCLFVKDGCVAAVDHEVAKLATSLQRIRKHMWWLLAASIVAGGLFAWGTRRYGAGTWFNLTSPHAGSGARAARDEAYAHWWAAVAPFHAGAIFWIGVGVVALYLTIASSLIGASYGRFLRSTRQMLIIGYNEFAADGYGGRGQVRTTVMWSVAGTLLLMISLPSLGYLTFHLVPVWLIVAAVVMFAVRGLAIILGVLGGLRRRHAEFQALLVEEVASTTERYVWRQSLGQQERLSEDELQYRTRVLEELERVRRWPHLPFRAPSLLLAGALWLFTIVPAIIQIVVLLR
jgi:hypothetical protein